MLGNLYLVAQFANVLRMLISCSKGFYSPYLSIHGNLSNGLWISLQILLEFRVRMACLFVLISLVSSVNSSLFLWGRESLVLFRYYNSSLNMFYYYWELLPIYSMIKMLILQLNFGRVYGRYLVARLFYI